MNHIGENYITLAQFQIEEFDDIYKYFVIR